MYDPFGKRTAGLDGPSNDMFLITPDDVNDLAKGVRALRIYNPATTESTVKFKTLGGVDVTLTVPAASLCIEQIRVSRVYSTGTTPALIIHGYTESEVVHPNTV